MEMIASAVLILLAAAFVALPFLRPEQAPPVAPPPGVVMGDAERQKSDAYAAIKEADFDFEMGKLSEADYRLLRDKYAAQALAAIAALATPAAAAAPRSGRRPRLAYCPQCGSPVAKGANFCGACGSNLKLLAA